MGAHQSKQNKRRAHHGSSSRHQPPPPPTQSHYQQQHHVTRQPLRSQQLQQQRQRASLKQQQQQKSVSHPFVPEQQSQLHLPVSPPQPAYTAEPLLIEDEDDDDDVQRRLSIEFMDSQSSILLKNKFAAVVGGGDSTFSSTSSHNASTPSLANYDQPLYLPPTMSSITSSSSASSARTALFSTLSSLSSTASSISSIHIKQAHDATLPILDHHHPTTSHTASSSTLTLPATATVVDDENQRMDEAYNRLDRWIMQPDISDRQVVAEAYYPYAVFHYYGLSPSRQPNYPLAYKYFQQAAKENMVLLQTCRDQEQRERIIGIISNAQYNLGEMWASGKGVARVDTIKATQYFKAAAENQHATARYMMGYYHHHGIAMSKTEQPRKNIDQAIEWYTLAAEQGHDKAQAALGTLLLDGRQPQEALKWLHLAADKEEHVNADALLQLAYVYEEGVGDTVTPNKRLAFEYYERYLRLVPVSDPQYGNMHYLMGISFRNHSLLNDSTDLATDHERAIMHLTRAANAGHAQAQRALGTMYEQGLGFSCADEHQAHALFTKAAAQGDVLALGSLGKQYEWGRGCIRDTTKAIQCYQRAADSGCVPAQLALAMLFEKLGRIDDAMPWFERVANADKDDLGKVYRSTAQLRIALHKRDRTGLEALASKSGVPDEAHYWLGRWWKAEKSPKAFQHFLHAAELGHMLSQFHVADILANGLLGVSKDRVAAYHWYTKASAQGHALSQLCEALYYIQAIQPVAKVDLAKAESLLRCAVRKGSPEAMVRLAQVLLKTSLDKKKEAVDWLLKAASKDDTSAMRELANIYESDGDYKSGYEWLQRATDEQHNDPRAWYALSQYYEKGWWCWSGEEAEPDVNKALECLRKAEALGYIRASFEIALLYERRSQWTSALRQYDVILQKFDATSHPYGWHALLAKHRLEVLHGAGVNSADSNKMVREQETYRSLSEMVQTHKDKAEAVEAFELLGICCENGLGIQCDITRAMAWYTKATRLNIPTTSTSLALDQARTRCRLVHLLITHEKHNEALEQLRLVEPYLDQMKGHVSSETVTQAREARYHLGHLLLHHQNQAQEAKRWLIEAAAQGHTGAMYELGKQAMREGNHSEAKHRFSQGHVMGHASSKRELALLLLQDVDSNENDHSNNDDDDDDDDERNIDMIKYLLEEAVDMQDTEAMFELGQLYEHGLGKKFPADRLEAYALYKMAGALQHKLACVYAGEVCYGLKRFTEALDWFRRVPDHWIARFRMALYGLQLEPDAERTWFTTLCDAVPTEPPSSSIYERRIWSKACECIGECFERGQGTDQDVEQAILWYTRSADLASVRAVSAMHRLAQIYDKRKQDDSVLEWLRAAAEQGDSEAQFQVGLFHKYGRGGLLVNSVAAASYLSKAMVQRHPRATYELADTYWQIRDYPKGWQCFQDAADKQGIVEALRALGFLYDRGFAELDRTGQLFTVTQDRMKAIDYFCKAADMNDKASILMLGSYYEASCLQEDSPLEKALAFYEKAGGAQSTNPVLEFVIGRLFHTMADHAPALHREAFIRFERAANIKSQEMTGSSNDTQTDYSTANAQIMVALYHLYGWYAPEHKPKKGFEMLLQLERDGNNDVQRDVKEQIARCYENGIGTTKDLSQALLHWKRLCELGVKNALVIVEEYHKDGIATDEELQSAQRSFRATQVDNIIPSEEREETASSSASSYTN